MTDRRVLVLGGTGYVGSRLVPHLVGRSHRVRCLTRSADSLDGVAWATDVDVVEGDLFDPDTLAPAFTDVDTVVYLVHSLGDEDFEEKELECATNTQHAAERAGVRHIVYLSGLGDDDTELSAHLRSRHDVGRVLAAGAAEVTELRAAVVIGSGSASFEMLRHLTDILPVMTAPRWVSRTLLQPIAVEDILVYLTAAVERPAASEGEPRDRHDIVEVGGPDTMTYADLIHVYADVCGLKRLIIPVPVVSPRLSTHWVKLVTPIPKQLATSLIDSLKNDVVVTDDSADSLIRHTVLTTREAVERAVAVVAGADDLVPVDADRPPDPAHPRPWDPSWAGGKLFQDRRELVTAASPEALHATVQGIGGSRGWFAFSFLWSVRGLLDQLFGGVGLRRGREHPDEIAVGDHLDFWRVAVIEHDLFRLQGEMKLPGSAWLEWATAPHPDGTAVVQRARYRPTGVLGRLYWYVLSPFHTMIFPLMLRSLVTAAEHQEPAGPPPAAEPSAAPTTEGGLRAPIP